MTEHQTVIRTERDPITQVLIAETVIDRTLVDGREVQTTCRETRYADGQIVFENRPVPCDRARVMIADAIERGALS